MKVLHTESSEGWGGQENRTLQEALQLRTRGVDVTLVCPPGSGLAQRAGDQGIAVTEIKMRRSFDARAILKLAGVMRRVRPDVVNTHSGRDTILAGLAARLLRPRPLIVRTRHLILPITSPLTYSRLPDHVVTVSEAVRDNLIASGVPADRIDAITTGVDCRRFDPEAVSPILRRELGLAVDDFLIGTVAILRFKKGHQELLDAASLVLRTLPGATFVIAGDGPQRENIERAIAERGLGERVRLLGLRRDIPQVLRSLDLFVLPTHEEAFGTSYLEAQAMGVPVIGTRVGGVPEALREGHTGLLVPAKNPEALAAAIIELGLDPVRRSALGAAGRDWVRAEHTTEKMAERMLALYQRLLDARAGR